MIDLVVFLIGVLLGYKERGLLVSTVVLMCLIISLFTLLAVTPMDVLKPWVIFLVPEFLALPFYAILLYFIGIGMLGYIVGRFFALFKPLS